MALAVDIKMLGDKELERMLSKLPDKAQRKVMRQAMRKTAKSLKDEVVARVPVDTGKLKSEMAKVKVKPGKRSRNKISMTVPYPTREALGIEGDDGDFYPIHVEFGHGRAPARPYTRPAVDSNADREINAIAAALRKGIPKEAARLARQ